ncbi:hypothetical protein, partial [Pseudovibrio sp. POLY-S9]|uniref:hypothetical protein n=1 Tax=Pseudovibrio sp. POLY-S9 TaxID=1576596 RepID=UPI001AD90B42
ANSAGIACRLAHPDFREFCSTTAWKAMRCFKCLFDQFAKSGQAQCMQPSVFAQSRKPFIHLKITYRYDLGRKR